MEKIERSVLFHFPLLGDVARGSGYMYTQDVRYCMDRLKSRASGFKLLWQRIPHNSDYVYFKYKVSI